MGDALNEAAKSKVSKMSKSKMSKVYRLLPNLTVHRQLSVSVQVQMCMCNLFASRQGGVAESGK